MTSLRVNIDAPLFEAVSRAIDKLTTWDTVFTAFTATGRMRTVEFHGMLLRLSTGVIPTIYRITKRGKRIWTVHFDHGIFKDLTYPDGGMVHELEGDLDQLASDWAKLRLMM